MSKSEIHKKLILFSLLGTIVLGFGTVISWTFPRPTAKQAFLDSDAINKTRPHRQLASIISLAEALPNHMEPHQKMLTLKLDCNTNKNFFPSMAKQIRITGDVCFSKDGQPEKIKIVNSTNNFVANIFKIPNRAFSTDYIYLREGDNVITIEHSSNDTVTRVSKLIIKRVKEAQLTQ